jgi:cysteinyl-tRNA synthetase
VLALHDTVLGTVVLLEPRVPGELSMYICGPTVYGLPHVGHGRATIVYDVLRRYLEWRGMRVRLVSNITDIDDNIIARANEEGRSTDAVVDHYEREWWDAMDALGVARPTDVPHATAWVAEMVALIERLVADNKAYETSDGVYFVASSVADYGLLAQQSLDDLRAGARVDAVEEKRDQADFALWKKAKPGEPFWSSPWGDGRPGWHTECVVMSLGLLGDGFDLHGGGQDLKFPHHENERAQAVAWGRPFARRWMHHGFVVDPGGEKMSKSLGNFTSLTDLLRRLKHDGRPLRLLILQSHYRSPMTVSGDTVEAAVKAVARLDEFARRFPPSDVAPDAGATDAFTAAMDEDLNTPVAVGLVFEQVGAAHAAADAGDQLRASIAAATVRHLVNAVGLVLGTDGDIPAEIAELVAQRDRAREAKDWPASDLLRDELAAMGWVVKDTPQGTVVHRRSAT